eukprot:m.37002 g.37002  ORF g.37002 m.37002 type:complete len:487 (-) comp5464_c0_seq1:108-1568(-)
MMNAHINIVVLALFAIGAVALAYPSPSRVDTRQPMAHQTHPRHPSQQRATAALPSSAAHEAGSARQPVTNWSTIPLFAHFRMANFSASDLQLMDTTLRTVTMQGTLYGTLSGEEQAAAMRSKLEIPVFVYRNLYYAEPWDASTQVVKATPAWQLRGADGRPLNPEGKYVYNMTVPAVQQFYSNVIANLSSHSAIDGAFADSGCGVRPAWLSPAQQTAFAAGQVASAAASQTALNAQGGIFIQNCPYLPRSPGGGAGDPWPQGVRGSMYESWCSDFQTGVGGPGSAEYCRYEVMFLMSGPAGWKNGSIVQARYYLSEHNKHDPRFGAVAFMVAGFPGAFFGASVDWWWDGDWETQSLASWSRQPLGTPGPAQMLDKSGCGWSRTFASGAHVFLNMCSSKGHPMQAHAVWADNSTWPPSLGAEGAAGREAEHISRASAGDVVLNGRIPISFALHTPMDSTADPCPEARGGGSLILDPRGNFMCLGRAT